jgi:hypothetical protein
VKLGWAALVGRYRLELDDELLAFIEHAFVRTVPVADQAAARSAALAEARGAELELYPDGTLVSRSGAAEFVRVRLDERELGPSGIVFDKAPGKRVRLESRDHETLVAHQVGQPPALFRRVRA